MYDLERFVLLIPSEWYFPLAMILLIIIFLSTVTVLLHRVSQSNAREAVLERAEEEFNAITPPDKQRWRFVRASVRDEARKIMRDIERGDAGAIGAWTILCILDRSAAARVLALAGLVKITEQGCVGFLSSHRAVLIYIMEV